MNDLGGLSLHRIALEATLAQGESRPEKCKCAGVDLVCVWGQKDRFNYHRVLPTALFKSSIVHNRLDVAFSSFMINR